jgi:methionyl aminopeptidase
MTREVRQWVKQFVKPGMRCLDIAEAVEREILARGGYLPFPCGIGVNQVTAHYAPPLGDESSIEETDVVKVDFGVHFDGYLTDTAVTVTFNPEYEPLLDATEKALAAAVATVREDVRAGEIGRSISNQAARYGFRVIENLTGHSVDRYMVHAGKSIPNLFLPNLHPLKRNDVVAIEPFLTLKDAAGYVVDEPTETIFSIVARKHVGIEELDGFISKVWDERKTLPFTPRWYGNEYKTDRLASILKDLVRRKLVRAYPTLVEAAGKPVAQFEHTMALGDKGLVVLT